MSRACLLALAGLLLGACSTDDTGYLVGDRLVIKSCNIDGDATFAPFQLDGRFFAIEQLGEIAFIRMQSSGKPLYRSDAFVLEVVDAQFVRQRLGVPIPFNSPKVRASLHVMASCPDTAQAMTARNGSITFASYETEKGGRIRAKFDFELFDERTGEVLGLGFRGELDFTVKVGKPYQPFSRQQ